MKQTILAALAATLMALTSQAGAWIRINQLGYLPQSTKVAVWMSSDASHVADFELIDDYTGQVAYRGTKVTPTRPLQFMQSTARLDFSDFTRPGAYRIRVGQTLSPVFPINCHVYDGTADFLLNYMRQQQCGFNPFQNDSCHTRDAFVRYHPSLEGQHIDVRGGWHDAADLLQYTTTSANAIYQLMFAYQQHPEVFGDRYAANGTRGCNGIPDIVDQIKWGLDWLDKMNPVKGELYNQIADDRDHIGMKMPKDDPADYGRGPGGGRPVYYVNGKPQQRGKYLNATMGAASTAGKFASDFAVGSKVLAPFYPDFATRIGNKAADAFQVGIDMPGNAQTVSVVSPYIYEEDNWVDDMELGAIELYRMTGDARYLTQAIEYGRREPVTPWMGADSARHYQWYPFKYEFGNKVLVVRSLSGLILGALSFRNEYDGHTIDQSLEQVKRISGKELKRLAGDRGYRGKKKSGVTEILIPDIPKVTDSYYKKRKKRKLFCKRAGIEHTIGHLKSDFRLGRNFYKGVFGDNINIMLAAAAYNFKRAMRLLLSQLRTLGLWMERLNLTTIQPQVCQCAIYSENQQ